MATRDVYADWIAQLFPPQGKWRESDYFALPDAMQIIELSDGEITMSPTPSYRHQESVAVVGFRLRQLVEENGLGKVIIAPFAVRLWEGKIREPDVLFIRKENLDRIKSTHLDGPPDWIAEVISPGSRGTDEVDKLAEYAQAGVPEYWLLDPEDRTIRVYHLGAAAYGLKGAYIPTQTVASVTIPGFEVQVGEVFGWRLSD